MAADYRSPLFGSTLALAAALSAGACASSAPTDRGLRPTGTAPAAGVASTIEARDERPPPILGPVGPKPAPSTPRNTVQRFLRALDARNYEALRALAPPDLRASMTLEALRRQVDGDPQGAEDLLRRLKRHQHDPIAVDGTRASMPYGGRTFELAYMDGAWVVGDPD